MFRYLLICICIPRQKCIIDKEIDLECEIIKK